MRRWGAVVVAVAARENSAVAEGMVAEVVNCVRGGNLVGGPRSFGYAGLGGWHEFGVEHSNLS